MSDFASNVLAKNINYIIKTVSSAGAALTAKAADGTALDTRSYKDFDGNTRTFNVAHAGDSVLLEFEVQEGYDFVAAYSDEGKTAKIIPAADGKYIIVTPDGGGVMLSVETKLKSFDLTFDLGGGTYNGQSTYTVKANYGDKIILPKPEKAGKVFAHWEGSVYYAGDEYVVTGPHSFKAIWKDADEKKDDTPKKTVVNTSVKG